MKTRNLRAGDRVFLSRTWSGALRSSPRAYVAYCGSAVRPRFVVCGSVHTLGPQPGRTPCEPQHRTPGGAAETLRAELNPSPAPSRALNRRAGALNTGGRAVQSAADRPGAASGVTRTPAG